MSPEAQQQIDAEIEAAYQRGLADGRAAAKREWILKASDALNKIINGAVFGSKDILQQWANEIGRPLHTAIPGIDVNPHNQKSD